MEFYEAWEFLRAHPIFKLSPSRYAMSRFADCLDIDVVKVDPDTLRIEEDGERNTRTQVWLECGPLLLPKEYHADWEREEFPLGQPCHDWRLDVGGDTFEEAVVALAGKVRYWYGTEGKGRGGAARWTEQEVQQAAREDARLEAETRVWRRGR